MRSRSYIRKQFFDTINEQYRSHFEACEKPHRATQRYTKADFDADVAQFNRKHKCDVRVLFKDNDDAHPDRLWAQLTQLFDEQTARQAEHVNQFIIEHAPSRRQCERLVRNNCPLPPKLTTEQFISELFDGGDADSNGVRGDSYRSGSLYGGTTLREHYNAYSQRYDTVMNRVKQTLFGTDTINRERQQYLIEHNPWTAEPDAYSVEYPFATKHKKFLKANRYADAGPPLKDRVPDPRLQKQFLQRPYYSPYPGAWEIDHADFDVLDKPRDSQTQRRKYLFVININTRFLIVFPCDDTAEAVKWCLEKLLEIFPNGVKSIRGDGSGRYSTPAVRNHYSTQEVGSGATNDLIQWYRQHNVRFYFDGGEYINKNRIVDRAMRTVRDAIGHAKITDEQLANIVWYYNNTPHKGLRFIKTATGVYRDITPYEMQCNPELEWEYIRYCETKLLKAKIHQSFVGLYNYIPGNVLMLHVNESKTSMKFNKVRRTFHCLGEFVRYDSGNVVVKPITVKNDRLTVDKHNIIVIPIYCTRKLADDVNSLSDTALHTFNEGVELVN